jgi:hypothetical protein
VKPVSTGFYCAWLFERCIGTVWSGATVWGCSICYVQKHAWLSVRISRLLTVSLWGFNRQEILER